MSSQAAPPNLKFGALINPNSRKNRRRLPDISALRAAGAIAELPADVAEATTALRRMAEAEVGLLAIHGGDGTVLAALTAILCDDVFERPPILCLLPGGTTNMTAADVGWRPRRPSLIDIARLAEQGGGNLTTRPILRLDGVFDADGNSLSRAGMFFGAIGICRAITFCRRHLHSRGVVGGAASWLTLAPLLIRNLIVNDENGVLAGAEASIRVLENDQVIETIEGPFSVLMASSLRQLALNARPFWGQGPAEAIDATFVQAPPPKLARNIGPMLFGREKRPPEPGYISRRTTAFDITYAGDVTLDGEIYEARADQPFRLSSAGPIEFLVG
ncbi:MAG: diacylglycerol/lipid kinase family protein [Alphaproteobacteria bacterium]